MIIRAFYQGKIGFEKYNFHWKPHFLPPLHCAFAQKCAKNLTIFSTFYGWKFSGANFHFIFKKCINALFALFIWPLHWSTFYFFDQKEATFSKGSRSLWRSPFYFFGQKCTFYVILTSKCREMSGHYHGFRRALLTKKYFIWPLYAVF